MVPIRLCKSKLSKFKIEIVIHLIGLHTVNDVNLISFKTPGMWVQMFNPNTKITTKAHVEQHKKSEN